jgi:hypothetical protein
MSEQTLEQLIELRKEALAVKPLSYLEGFARQTAIEEYEKEICQHVPELLERLGRLEAGLEHVARHYGSAEQCREIAANALRSES